MLQTKRSRIAVYLQNAAPSPFSALLSDWYSGQMEEELARLGLAKLKLHIDWLEDYKCIDIQGRLDGMYVDIQIEPNIFSVAADEDEPDEPVEYPLASDSGFYQILRSFLASNSPLGTT